MRAIERSVSTLARYGRSFRLAGRLLPGCTLELAADLYAFCREIDDLADEGANSNAARQSLGNVRCAVLSGDNSHPLAAIFLALHQSHAVSREAAITLIDTVMTDLEPVCIVDEAALLRYAHGVAGTVGLMMCAILDTHGEQAARYAVDLGIAMQLTNIARDVSEDADRGRLYLPATWLPAGMTVLTLHSDRVAAFAAVQMLLDRADRHYRSAEQGYRYLPRRVQPAIRAAASLYEEIGIRILAHGPGYLCTGRCVVSLPRKLWIMASSLMVSKRLSRYGDKVRAEPVAVLDVIV